MRNLKAQLTRTEFLDWLEILEADQEREIKQEYYFARIAAEICRGRVENPALVKTEDFLIKLEPRRPETELTPEEYLKRSKGFWGALVGMELN